MQYVFNERREYIQTIEFKNTNPILNVDKINGFKEEGLVGIIVKKEFSYSFDNINWQPWQTLTTANIQSISFNDEKHFYLHVKFTRSNVAAGNIRSFYILYASKIDTDPGFPISSSDAGTLNGEPGSYYLNLWNHYGGLPANSIMMANVGGGAGVFSYTDYDPSQTRFYLRSILAGTGISVTQNADTLVITSDASFSAAGENIGNGDISIYYGNNITGDLQFRTLKYGYGIVLSSDASGTITINASLGDFALKADLDQFIRSASIGDTLYWDASNFLNVSTGFSTDASIFASKVIFDPSSLDASLAMPVAVGGIPAGTTVYALNNDDVTSLLIQLLFPAAYPTLTNPSATFTASTTGLQEVSTLLSLTFVTTFSRGAISPQYSATSPFRSGSCNYFDYTYTGTGNGNLIDTSTDVSIDNQALPTYRVVLGSQSWSADVSYNAGVQPYDNKGNIYLTPLSAGKVTASSTRSIEGVYPIFATTSNITTLTQQALVSATTTYAPSAAGILFVGEDDVNKNKFDVPVPWTQANPLTGVQWFNTNNNTWEYLGANNLPAESLALWTQSSTTNSIQGYTIQYTRYTWNGAKAGPRTIRLVI